LRAARGRGTRAADVKLSGRGGRRTGAAGLYARHGEQAAGALGAHAGPLRDRAQGGRFAAQVLHCRPERARRGQIVARGAAQCTVGRVTADLMQQIGARPVQGQCPECRHQRVVSLGLRDALVHPVPGRAHARRLDLEGDEACQRARAALREAAR
jgi:hypothetical protein